MICSYRDTPTATTPCHRALVGREDDLLPIHAYFNFACKCHIFFTSYSLYRLQPVGLPTSWPIAFSLMRSHTIFQPPSMTVGRDGCWKLRRLISSLELLEDIADAVRNEKDPRRTEKPIFRSLCSRRATRDCFRLLSVRGM